MMYIFSWPPLVYMYLVAICTPCACISFPILGDLGAVSLVGRKGGTKVFKYWRKSPWLGTDSHRTISKISSRCRHLIGHKKCFVLLCPIGEQSLLSSFPEFVHDHYRDHAPKKCTQSGNFRFDIKSPSDFKILSAWKVKTLFQKYKLELTKGIHPCIGHVLRNY